MPEGYAGAGLRRVIASLYMSVGKHEREVANADFIAHAREDIPLLLAAIEAALKLADEWEMTAATLDGGTARANALLDCTASFREAITRELTAKEAGDGGR